MKHRSKAPFWPKIKKQGLKNFTSSLFFLVLLIAVVLVFSTYLFSRLWFSPAFSHFLPASNTLAYVEVNLDSNSPAQKDFYKFFNQSSLISPQLFKVYQEELFPSLTLFQPLLKNRAGIALLGQNSGQNLVFYFRVNSESEMQDFLNGSEVKTLSEKALRSDLQGHPLFSFTLGSNFSLLKINNDLFVSDSLSALDLIAKTKNGQLNSLRNNSKFNEIASPLPDQSLVFAWVDQQLITQSLLHNQNYLQSNIRFLTDLLPLFKITKSSAFSLKPEGEKLVLRMVTGIDSKLLGKNGLLKFDSAYQGKIFNLLQNLNYDAVFGGRNLKYEYLRLGEIYKSRSALDQALFQGQISDFFSTVIPESLDLAEDILPLFSKEYSVAYRSAKSEFVLITEMADPEADFYRWSRFLEEFKPKFAAYAPLKVEVELPDGTKGEQLVSSPENIQITEQDYQGIKIQSLSIKDRESPVIFSAKHQNVLIVSNSLAALAEINDQLSQTKNHDFKNFLPGADEMAYSKLGILLKQLPLPEVFFNDPIFNYLFNYSKKYQQNNIITELSLIKN